MDNMIHQGTSDWLKQRLGCFTGSAIGDLMTKGKKKDDIFGQKAMEYIYHVAAERNLLQAYIDDDYLWEIYQNQVSVSNKYLTWGHENEPLAVEMYESMTGRVCEEVGSISHPHIPNFAASPDRLTTDNGKPLVVEIKSPMPKTFMLYKAEVKDNASLLATKPGYYWQIQAELSVTGCKEADFVCFCPFLKNPLHIVRITADEDAQKEIEFRINEAEKIIKNLIN